MGERGAEERHDAVASHFVHCAFIVMDGLHHPLDHRVEEFAGLLGIVVSEQLHGALEVGEENCDMLAFPFECALRGENLFDQVLGGVTLRRGEPGCSMSGGNGLPTLEAKLRAGRQGAMTLSACEREAYSTLQTELGVRMVFVLAPGQFIAAAPRGLGVLQVRHAGTIRGSAPITYALTVRGLDRAMFAYLEEVFNA